MQKSSLDILPMQKFKHKCWSNRYESIISKPVERRYNNKKENSINHIKCRKDKSNKQRKLYQIEENIKW